jgi:hypothetical protein
VPGTLWLGDDEVAAQELQPFGRAEDADLDEPLVLETGPAPGPTLGRVHGRFP